MELFVLRHDEWRRRYLDNCSLINIDTVPLAQRQHFAPMGWTLVVLATVYMTLYFPCMFSFAKHLRDDNGRLCSCYCLLFFIGLIDMVQLVPIGFLHGYFAITGTVYCQHPYLIYFAGCVAVANAAAESLADVMLAFNRCVDILSATVGEMLFGGNRVLVWLAACSAYGFFFILHTTNTFNPLFFAWCQNPFEGYLEDEEHMFTDNWLKQLEFQFTAGTLLVYAVFGVGLFIKIKTLSSEHRSPVSVSKVQQSVFIQIAIISAMNTCAGTGYYLLELYPNTTLTTFSHWMWFHVHGFPPVIYLAFNKTIREDCKHFVRKFLAEFRANKRTNDQTAGGTHSLFGAFSTALVTSAVAPLPKGGQGGAVRPAF